MSCCSASAACLALSRSYLVGAQIDNPTRRPREEHGNHEHFRIVDDLREPVGGIIKAVVEAVHEYHRRLRRRFPEQRR